MEENWSNLYLTQGTPGCDTYGSQERFVSSLGAVGG